ncbi:hypothetical protein [Lysobacter gummosus]
MSASSITIFTRPATMRCGCCSRRPTAPAGSRRRPMGSSQTGEIKQ